LKRVALVTGASRGVGLEMCRQLAAAGCTVVLTARDAARGEKAAAALRQEGHDVRFQLLDVTDAAAVRRVAIAVEGDLGRLDALINNAAVVIDPKDVVGSLDLDVLRRTLETNLLGALSCCQAFLPLMVRQGHGRIVNVSSGKGSFAKLGPGGPSYRISKAALNALTVILAEEVKQHNVLVNAMTPGWVRTRMGGVRAPRSIAEGAEAAVWLALLPDDGPHGKFFRDREELPW
jgi:NAD(P)-dependent dehydrogenase (short-subunit alcohol dehydrogenase family)